MDTATSGIRVVEFISSSDGDRPVLPDLLDQIPEAEDIGTVTADGAYGSRHRPRGHGDHTDPQEGSALERGLPSRNRPKRNSARHSLLRLGVLEKMDGIPRPKPDRSEDAVPKGLR
jgi:hypothetical protein